MLSKAYQIHHQNNSRSRQRGQALVQGTAAIVLVTAIIVGASLLITSAGLAIYYKSKLAYAATVGAKYCGQGAYFLGAKRPNYDNNQLALDVVKSVNAALIGEGLPAAKINNIIAKSVTVGGVEGMQVTVKEDGLEILSGGLLPSNISLSETAFYAYANDNPTAILGLSIGGTSASPNGQGLFVPMYGGGSVGPGLTGEQASAALAAQGPVPTGEYNYWKVQLSGEKVPAFSKGATDYSSPGNLLPCNYVAQFGNNTGFGSSKN